MSVDAILAYGARLYYSEDGISYTELVDMKSIGPPPHGERPDVDVTPLADSVAARQFRQGLATAGECAYKQFYNKTRLALLAGYFANNTILYWRLRVPDNAVVNNTSRVDWIGRIKKLDTLEEIDDVDKALLIPWTVKITGAVTFTQGS